MASARVVALALLVIADLVAAARAQAPLPGEPPAEGTWPSDAPPAPSPPPPNAVQQQCVAEYTALRSRVERMGMAARAGSETRVPRDEMCKLVTAYAAAEIKWLKYAEMNMTKCGIPYSVVNQMTTVHIKTLQGQKKLCAAGLEPGDLRENHPDFRSGPPTQPIDLPPRFFRFGPPTQPIDLPPRFMPRVSGRSMP